MRKFKSRGRTLARVAAPALVLALVGLTAPAYAAEGSIDHVEEKDGKLQILYSIPGGPEADLGSVAVSLGTDSIPAKAVRASGAAETVRRTTVLAMDVSNSMRGDRITAAKAAATTFLDNAPDDLNIGLVTFAGAVTTVVQPTTNHDTVKSAVDALALSKGTRLYQGVAQAVTATGKEGARSVLVLSDGADSTKTPIATALTAITAGAQGENQVKVDVVAIAQAAAQRSLLAQMADAGGGTVLDADQPDQIEGLFADEAAALAQQVLVTGTPDESLRGEEGELRVTINAGAEIYTATTFAALSDESASPTRPESLRPADSGLRISETAMWLGLGGAAVAAVFLVMAAAGGIGRPKQDALQASIDAYTRQGAKKLAAAASTDPQQSVTQQAVGAAARVLESNKGIEAALGGRLEAAGLQIKPAEWLLIHAGLTFGAGLVGLLLGGGSIIWLLLGLFLGAFVPWMYLGFKRSRRLKAFSGQLADTLQLMAGSLSAGLSLAQSVDTVVREGTEPIGGEFRRALIETRLGVEIEDALAGIADRMQSKDFEWVVMAIRIQREVGGNLAELLNRVAETIREREYLERQVLTLSAEGRLSVWILGGLPPGFMLYLLMANPTYLKPLYSETLGFLMLGTMVVLETVGVLWMKKLVKVDV